MKLLARYILFLLLLCPLSLSAQDYYVQCEDTCSHIHGIDLSHYQGNVFWETIGDNTHITARTVLLCHKKDLKAYHKYDDYAKLPYMKGEIHIGKGCSTGTGTMIMPGVTIGDGAIIGAYSLVTKDIPAWTIAVGRPAKVIKQIPKRNN